MTVPTSTTTPFFLHQAPPFPRSAALSPRLHPNSRSNPTTGDTSSATSHHREPLPVHPKPPRPPHHLRSSRTPSSTKKPPPHFLLSSSPLFFHLRTPSAHLRQASYPRNVSEPLRLTSTPIDPIIHSFPHLPFVMPPPSSPTIKKSRATTLPQPSTDSDHHDHPPPEAQEPRLPSPPDRSFTAPLGPAILSDLPPPPSSLFHLPRTHLLRHHSREPHHP